MSAADARHTTVAKREADSQPSDCPPATRAKAWWQERKDDFEKSDKPAFIRRQHLLREASEIMATLHSDYELHPGVAWTSKEETLSRFVTRGRRLLNRINASGKRGL
jgi:hypothetical protein